MAEKKAITIIGGGLAGLTLGIGLRQRFIPTTIFESGQYPRHRVCGEFISGKGQDTLKRLGLTQLLLDAGAIPARTVAFFSSRAASAIRELDKPAWSISRFSLDELLAKQFTALGGELRANERWREAASLEGVVRASGRRVQPVADGWRWFGLKVHARNISLNADLEMHLSPGGYLGMSRLSNGEVNICGLFRRPAKAGDAVLPWQEIMRGAPGSARYERLASAEFDETSFCSIAGLSLKPQLADASNECSIGDAITMIPPVTGNGMSMAFESAEFAIEPLVNYAERKISWAEAQGTIAQRCDKAFSNRLAWAGRLQRMMFRPRLQTPLVLFAPRWKFFWQFLVTRMR